MEIWKDIKDFEGFYQVSNFGNVRSCNRIVNKQFLKGEIRKPRLKNDYYRIALQKNMKRKEFGVHNLVAIMFIDNPENKPIVNHKDGNKQNNHVDNLEWVTYSENSIHAHTNGLVSYTKHNPHIVTVDQSDTPGEIWKTILNYNKYEISNLGRIKRFSRIRKPVLGKDYYRINLCKSSTQKTFYIHILVAENFIGSIPKDFIVNHKDGNKLNNAVENLEIISKQDNVVHAYKNNLTKTKKGSDHQNSKITEDDVHKIFELRKEGKTHKEIAAIFNISREQVRDIINRKRWKHLKI